NSTRNLSMRLKSLRKLWSRKNRSAFQLEALEPRVLMSTSHANDGANAMAPAAAVAITVRYTNELVITGTGSNDTVDISQTGTTLKIIADGQTYTQNVPQAGLFVYTRGGTDSITIESTVTVRTTVDTIDGSKSTIQSSGGNVSVWMDSTDTE